jgi:UDP-N-acetylmuramoyl-L-alanyl-D-glutamate--2,6-diaminopimelate ligase
MRRREPAGGRASGQAGWGLGALLREALGVDRADLAEVPVAGVAQAVERVVRGGVFVARRGRVTDAHDLIGAALDRGAVCVVGSRQGLTRVPGSPVPYVYVADDRWATSAVSATFHRHPSHALTVAGVTGTDGKTTTSTLLHHLLEGGAGTPPVGLVSSAAIRLGQQELPLEGHFTTPEATEVHELLARFRDAGARLAVLESSSHGFALKRLEHVRYALAVWTTLTPEHLNDHGSMAEYLEAKRTLVRRAPIAVLNRDDPAFADFAHVAHAVVSYGVRPEAEVRAVNVRAGPDGICFDLEAPGEERLGVDLPMVGTFNVHNALAALAAAHALGVPWRDGVRLLRSFPGVPGRMQLIAREPFAVVVDFAHTPPALAKALAAVSPARGGRRIVVIGAAGERDPGKREPLARTAVEGADLAVFTEEDHRSEDVGAILATMATAAEAVGAREGDRFVRVPDRREAILAACRAASAGDVVLLCGKGHERTLERGREALPWDEAAEALAALARLRGGSQPGDGPDA